MGNHDSYSDTSWTERRVWLREAYTLHIEL